MAQESLCIETQGMNYGFITSEIQDSPDRNDVRIDDSTFNDIAGTQNNVGGHHNSLSSEYTGRDQYSFTINYNFSRQSSLTSSTHWNRSSGHHSELNKQNQSFAGGILRTSSSSTQQVIILTDYGQNLCHNLSSNSDTIAQYARRDVPVLVDLLQSKDQEVQTAAAAVLEVFTHRSPAPDIVAGRDAIAALTDVLSGANAQAKAYATRILSHLTSTYRPATEEAVMAGIIPATIPLLYQSPELQKVAAGALTTTANNQSSRRVAVQHGAVEGLKPLLSSKDPDTRSAANALRTISSAPTCDERGHHDPHSHSFLHYLSHPEARIRHGATRVWEHVTSIY